MSTIWISYAPVTVAELEAIVNSSPEDTDLVMVRAFPSRYGYTHELRMARRVLTPAVTTFSTNTFWHTGGDSYQEVRIRAYGNEFDPKTGTRGAEGGGSREGEDEGWDPEGRYRWHV